MVFKCGQKFHVHCVYTGEYYDVIIAQVFPKRCCLIHLNNGNRHTNPVRVDDIKNITLAQFKKMLGATIDDVKEI